MLLNKSFNLHLMAVPTLINLPWRLRKRCVNFFFIIIVILNCVGNSYMVIQYSEGATSSGHSTKLIGRITFFSSTRQTKCNNEKIPAVGGIEPKCRQKRETEENHISKRMTSHSGGIHLRLETQDDLFLLDKSNARKKSPQANNHFSEQHKIPERHDNHSENMTAQLILHLVHPPQIVAPNFKLIVRDANGGISSSNSTIAFPSCLYTGFIEGIQTAKVSLSTCGGIKKLHGIILDDTNRKLILEPLPKGVPVPSVLNQNRHKRSTNEDYQDEFNKEESVLIHVYEPSLVEDIKKDLGPQHKSSCGLKPQNTNRLKAPNFIRDELQNFTFARSKRDLYSNLLEEVGYIKKLSRKKRKIISKPHDKVIELAVFIDDDLYKYTKEQTDIHGGDPIERIQDIVYAYLNAVQLLYHSDRLSTKIGILLVRMEIFTAPLNTLNKKDGEIESYLNSFCVWQKRKNPESWNKRSTHPDHWDHGLLLTGLDLYDALPEENSVIGLAWVSGMCHPRYSCTINEGKNFESVYVIAHEMGHNLGMNHDGETHEGNNCDPDEYLMSPILGPGKVSWSSCSSQELQQFLHGSSRENQAICLDDVPPMIEKYNYLKDDIRPGEKFNAKKQCQQSFDKSFIPHVTNISPFEDLCRELWCKNQTHALRAHPALEGTGCSEKPYPYGSHCIEGECVPFYPDDDDEMTGIDEDSNEVDNDLGNENAGEDDDAVVFPGQIPEWPDYSKEEDEEGKQNERTSNDIIPLWYDPIFYQIFSDLKDKYITI